MSLIEGIKDQLAKIFFFDVGLKIKIASRLGSLSQERLEALKSDLEQALDLQQKLIEEKIKKDPDFYRRFVAQKKLAEEAIISSYGNLLKKEESQKLDIIRNKIKTYN